MEDTPIVTVQQHILHQQQNFPEAKGTFSWLLSGITLATKMIEARVRRAGLLDVLGAADSINVQGEEQQILDVYANQALLHCLGFRESVAVLASEENDQPVTFEDGHDDARYAVVFDPLDGSSNIDVNVSVGTIFSILRNDEPLGDRDPSSMVLHPGTKQVAAGYVLYGSSTIFVYTTGNGVYGFTLDPAVGAYVLSHNDIKVPKQGSIYSVNDANFDTFPPIYRDYVQHLRSGASGRKYSARYIGSLVSDFHRNLLKGGVFLYPPTADQPEGKLRLLYEANPMAFIMEQAGGKSVDGQQRTMEIQPTSIHQRTPLVIGSATEVDEFLKMQSLAAQ